MHLALTYQLTFRPAICNIQWIFVFRSLIKRTLTMDYMLLDYENVGSFVSVLAASWPCGSICLTKLKFQKYQEIQEPLLFVACYELHQMFTIYVTQLCNFLSANVDNSTEYIFYAFDAIWSCPVLCSLFQIWALSFNRESHYLCPLRLSNLIIWLTLRVR